MNKAFPVFPILLLMNLLAFSVSYGDIYIYKDRHGNTLFSDRHIAPKNYRLIQKRHDYYKTYSHLEASRNKAYDPYIKQAADKFNLDPSLIKAMIQTESNFKPRAVSVAGAQGLMQLMPATAAQYDVNDPFHPEQNIMAGSKHMRYLLNLFNHNLDLALAAYNAGESPVKRYHGIPPFPETKKYVKKVRYLQREHQKISWLSFR